ncbi:hypothetical protein DFJ74DRAFT_304210 [Hyaloraphidium curvatum]|nr:hypothetical protein DFJ74DRAFT_304210 [Hyaloraphidium curvatum]
MHSLSISARRSSWWRNAVRATEQDYSWRSLNVPRRRMQDAADYLQSASLFPSLSCAKRLRLKSAMVNTSKRVLRWLLEGPEMRADMLEYLTRGEEPGSLLSAFFDDYRDSAKKLITSVPWAYPMLKSLLVAVPGYFRRCGDLGLDFPGLIPRVLARSPLLRSAAIDMGLGPTVATAPLFLEDLRDSFEFYEHNELGITGPLF